MNELIRLISLITYQLYANALLRCLLLGIAAYLLASLITPSLSNQLLMSLIGLGAGILFSKLYQDEKPQAIRLICDGQELADYG